MQVKEAISIALAMALALPAQQTGQALVAQDNSLKINIVEGEGARNNVRSRTAIPPVVEVLDAAGKPVVGAEVVFQLPVVGPSGTFNSWLTNQTVRTDEQGRATVNGYVPNTEEGRFNIKVTASSGTQTGSAVIPQINIAGPGAASASKSRSWLKWVAVAGGVALAGGVAAAVAGGDDAPASAARVPVTISAGAVTVGGPR